MAGPLRTSFRYDVFLSHSSADKPVVRELAERLRDAGLRVWLDEWIVQPGDLISQKIEDGLEQSALLLFCMSANAFGSDWVILESHSAIFRDPLNRDRRFVPLRLDDAPIKAMLRGYAYLDWRPGADREKEWGRLLAVTSIWPPAAALSRSSRSNMTENRWIWPVFNAGAIGLCEMASGPDRSEPIQAAKGLETAPQACGSLAGPLRIPACFRHGQVQQQLVAFGMGVGRAMRQSLLQQGDAPLLVAFRHLQAAEFGAGVGIAGPLLQLRFHGLPQPFRLVALGQQLGPVAVVDQGRFGAVGDAPVGLPLQQLRHAVVHQ